MNKIKNILKKSLIPLWKIAEKPTIFLRNKKFELFMKIIKPKEQEKVIDVGVVIGNNLGRGTNYFEVMYTYIKIQEMNFGQI